jgi:hypothetical protein
VDTLSYIPLNSRWRTLMMTRFRLAVTMFCALLTMLVLSWDGVQSDGPARPAAELGTGFSYQGQLELGNQPVNGSCDFQFSLWDAGTAGNQLGATQEVLALAVANGQFNTTLNAGNEFGAAFTGPARWLEIGVRCPAGSGTYAVQDPRLALTAVPYALSLRPGAEIVGNSSLNYALLVNPSDEATFGGIYSTGVQRGIEGRSANGDGVWGYGLRGVVGGTFTKDGIGVLGIAGLSAGSIGVWGSSTKSTGL